MIQQPFLTARPVSFKVSAAGPLLREVALQGGSGNITTTLEKEKIMTFVQKDKSLENVDVTVQVDEKPTFKPVPLDPDTLGVNLGFLKFVTPQHPDILINKLKADILYRVEDDPKGNLVVEEVSIGNG